MARSSLRAYLHPTWICLSVAQAPDNRSRLELYADRLVAYTIVVDGPERRQCQHDTAAQVAVTGPGA
jgi:hypothetical protein